MSKFEGEPVCCQNALLLTTKSVLFGADGQETLNGKFGNKCKMSKRFIVSLTRDKTTVQIFNIEEDCEWGTLSTKMSIVTCFGIVGNHILLTGQSDCAVCVWDLRRRAMLGRIPSHSVPVSAVTGSLALDLIVSIDEENNVSLTCLSSKHTMHFFGISEYKKSKHFVKIVSLGVIAISCFAPGNDKSRIWFYDLCGNFLKKLEFSGEIEAMDLVDDGAFGEVLVAATSLGKVVMVDCGGFRVEEKRVEGMVPRFLSRCGVYEAMTVRTSVEGGNVLFPVEFR
jgi:WD40 repeat protein